MTILGIETSAKIASIALLCDGAVVGERIYEARMTLNQRLAPGIAELLDEHAASDELDAIAAGVGPGSFTGVRMGVAVAKAMAHALGLPLAGVSAPEAIASGLNAEPGSAVLVLQKARADEVYATVLEIADDGIADEIAPTQVLSLSQALLDAAQMLDRAPEHVTGDAAVACRDDILRDLPSAEIAGTDHAMPIAQQVARIAALRPDRLDRAAAFTLAPRYVRLSQAEREFGVDLGLRG